MKTFDLRLLAADRDFYEGPCESIQVPLADGLIGILAGRADMICAIVPGELTMRIPASEAFHGQTEIKAVVTSGLLKVENSSVLVLVDSVELPEEIDENRARRAAERAKEELLQKQSVLEYKMAQSELARAMARLKYKNHKAK